jgi:hypothetical protein
LKQTFPVWAITRGGVSFSIFRRIAGAAGRRDLRIHRYRVGRRKSLLKLAVTVRILEPFRQATDGVPLPALVPLVNGAYK